MAEPAESRIQPWRTKRRSLDGVGAANKLAALRAKRPECGVGSRARWPPSRRDADHDRRPESSSPCGNTAIHGPAPAHRPLPVGRAHRISASATRLARRAAVRRCDRRANARSIRHRRDRFGRPVQGTKPGHGQRRLGHRAADGHSRCADHRACGFARGRRRV